MKKIVFLTGTRADFGKLKSLINITQEDKDFEVHIFVTGMHLNSKYGSTIDEVYKAGFKNIYPFINHDEIVHMDRTLAKTIDGFSHYISEIKPDLIVVHGDRSEALAGAIVGSLNNILVAHVEGGEISGTIDELIRHSVSKMSHIHFVSNDKAKKRLVQLGEDKNSIFVIGSPDLDLMNPEKLPSLDMIKNYYEINFKNFAILMFHPVTTEFHKIDKYIKNLVDAVIESGLNYIVIYPNNDIGSTEILREYERLKDNKNFKIFPSIRFEYFLQLLNSAEFIIGNSSAGIMEAPFYDVPTIDIGTRQQNRAKMTSVFHIGYKKKAILGLIEKIKNFKVRPKRHKFCFGDGKSDEKFLKLLKNKEFWQISQQKQFQEIEYE